MASPDLDPNQWYSMYVDNNNAHALWGTVLYNNQGTTGAVFINATQTNLATMRWQIYPVNSTTYVLRSKEGGANAFVGTHYMPASESEGRTGVRMVRGDVADDSVFWRFGAWGDATYWLYNAKNASGWHLNVKADGLLIMSNNISAPQNGQRWSFGSIAQINDSAYSSVALLGATMTSADTSALATPTGSASASTTPQTSSSASALPTTTPTASPGLSTGGKIGLGVALGIAALIALVVLGLCLGRRRARKQTEKSQAPVLPPRREEHYKHELDDDGGAAKYEMPSQAPRQTVTEVDARSQERPAELMGDVGRR